MAGKSSPEFLKKLAKAMLQEDLTNGTSQVGEAGPRNAGIMVYPNEFQDNKTEGPSLKSGLGDMWNVDGSIGYEVPTVNMPYQVKNMNGSTAPIGKLLRPEMLDIVSKVPSIGHMFNNTTMEDAPQLLDENTLGIYYPKHNGIGLHPVKDLDHSIARNRTITHETAHAVQDQMSAAPGHSELHNPEYAENTPYLDRKYEQLARQQGARTYFPIELTSAKSKYGVHPLLKHPNLVQDEFALGEYVPADQRELLEEEAIRLNELYKTDPKFRELLGQIHVSSKTHHQINTQLDKETKGKFNDALVNYIAKHSEQGGKK